MALKTVSITPVDGPLNGAVAPPGSKSITNRALLIAALARGRSALTGALKSDDTRHMATALRRMGVEIDEPDDTTFVVSSSGRLAPPDGPLFLGNAGTATRFLTAAAALVRGPVVVDGDAHMRKRPIGPLVEALGDLGVAASTETGCPPVRVEGVGDLPGAAVEIDGRLSSQYVSAVLMAAPCASRAVEIAIGGDDIGARGYVDLTLAAMAAFGAEAEEVDRNRWRVAPTGYRARDHRIEPDASAATYLWAIAALTGGRVDLGVAPEAMTQPDAAAHALIARFPHMPAVIDGEQMQDAVPTLAVLAAFNDGPVRFVGISNLRVKECDRIAALAEGLERLRPGLARVEGDDLLVAGDPALRGAETTALIDSFADHRIAMSFALAGLVMDGVRIQDPECVAKTYPGYWDMLAGLGVGLDVHDG